jgi:hypothetical protein
MENTLSGLINLRRIEDKKVNKNEQEMILFKTSLNNSSVILFFLKLTL